MQQTRVGKMSKRKFKSARGRSLQWLNPLHAIAHFGVASVNSLRLCPVDHINVIEGGTANFVSCKFGWRIKASRTPRQRTRNNRRSEGRSDRTTSAGFMLIDWSNGGPVAGPKSKAYPTSMIVTREPYLSIRRKLRKRWSLYIRASSKSQRSPNSSPVGLLDLETNLVIITLFANHNGLSIRSVWR